MPTQKHLAKSKLSTFLRTGCDRELYLSLHTDRELLAAEVLHSPSDETLPDVIPSVTAVSRRCMVAQRLILCPDIPIDTRIVGGGGRLHQPTRIDVVCREIVAGRRKLQVKLASHHP